MKHVIAILMIITSADMAVHTAEAQTRTSIMGTVTDPNGAVVAGAAIALRSADGTPPLKTTSDGSGKYRFEDAGPGPFTLEVDASGFRHFSRELRASAIGGENENVTLELAGLNESLLVTTATRSPLEIDKSPVSTSLVTRQEIETRNIHQVDQALLLTEGVNGSRAKGPADNDFGIGLRGFSAMGGSYRTLILLDGQPLNNSFIGSVNWSTFAPSEMERVEVARGPFSSLYGGNAMGGVINLVTRPVDRREIEVVGQYGSRDTTSYSFRAADRFFGKFGIGFGYSRYQTGGYAPQEVLRTLTTGTGGIPITGVTRWSTPTGGVNYQAGYQGRNWFNQKAYRLRGEYTFTPKAFLSVQYMRQSRGSGYDAYSTSLRDASGNPIDSGLVSFVENGIVQRVTVSPGNFIGIPTGQSSNMYQAQFLATVAPLWTLRIAGGFSHSPNDYFVSPAADATLSSGGGSYTNTSNRGINGNAQATRSSGGQTLVFGMESRADKARTGGQPIPNYALRENGGAFDTQAFGKAINHAGYVQYQRNILERLNIVTGGRWDYWKTYDGGSQAGAGLPLNKFAGRSTNALTGKVAAAYTLPGGWQIRGSLGNAFRNPTIYELYRDSFFFGSFLLGNPNVKSERLLAYEGGASHTFAGGHAFNISLFENRISDLIYRTTDPSDPTGRTRRLTNAALARTRGAEVSVQQKVTRWLQFREFYTYTNTIITKNPGVPETVGKRSPFLPRNTVGYSVTGAHGRVNSSWTGRYVGTQYSSGANLDITKGVPAGYDPFFEMDAAVTVQLHRHASIILSGDNLLDRRYHLYYLAQGRTIFGGLKLRY